MAEAPPNGLFWFAADDAARRAQLDGDRVLIDVAPHGPAGVSSIDLPGGGLLQVDHLDPTRLIGVESDLTTSGGSPLLVALFGGDDALRIVDRDGPVEPPAPDPDEEDFRSARRTRGRATQLDQDAQRAGWLVVLADLATDPAADPLARAVAASEFIEGIDATPGGTLFLPAVPGLVGHAVDAAQQVDDDSLAVLDRKLAVQIMAALRSIFEAASSGAVRSFLFELVQRIDSLAGSGDQDDRVAASMASAFVVDPFSADEFSANDIFEDAILDDEVAPAMRSDAARDRVSGSTVQCVRRSTSVLEVTAPRSDRPRWVRALRSDELVAVAIAPLQRDGLMESAELVVPPDTATDDLALHLVEADELRQLSGAPADLVRRAVRAGRAAASAERSGDRFRAMQRWQRCADLWWSVGDGRRAGQAGDRGTSRGGRGMAAPILADELDPYGVEDHVEEGR